MGWIWSPFLSRVLWIQQAQLSGVCASFSTGRCRLCASSSALQSARLLASPALLRRPFFFMIRDLEIVL